MTNIHLYRYVSLVIFRLEIRGENFSFFFFFFFLRFAMRRWGGDVWEELLLRWMRRGFSYHCFLSGNVNMSVAPWRIRGNIGLLLFNNQGRWRSHVHGCLSVSLAVFVCVSAYVCIVRMCVSAYVCIVRVCVCACVCVCMYCTYVCVCVCVCMYCTCVCVCR